MAGRRAEALALLAIEWETPYEAAMHEMAARLSDMARVIGEQLIPTLEALSGKFEKVAA